MEFSVREQMGLRGQILGVCVLQCAGLRAYIFRDERDFVSMNVLELRAHGLGLRVQGDWDFVSMDRVVGTSCPSNGTSCPM